MPLEFKNGQIFIAPKKGGAETDPVFLAQGFISGGKAGGQTAKGGTAASEKLTLMSTAHATKGKILFGSSAYNEANNRLGIGTASPGVPLSMGTPAAGRVWALYETPLTSNLFYGIALGSDEIQLRTAGSGSKIGFGYDTAGVYTPWMTLTSGKVGIGVTSPAAYLHLKAGTATANTAPFKFTSGTDLTTAEAGAVEYDGTNLHFTAVGTLRENIFFGAKSNGTLTAGTTTTVTHANAKTTSTILLQSTSAAFSPLGAYISAKNNGTFVITHTIATGAETFDFIIIN